MSSVIDQSISNETINSERALVPLAEDKIREYLQAHGLDNISNLHVFSTISSTNDYLLEHELENKQLAVCVAEQQTQGRGRYGHHWVSPAAGNLYLSMSWPLQSSSAQIDALSLWLLIAIAKLLEQEGCADVQLKWPNDICVQNKKLAGILIERKVSTAKNNLIIGVGLNVAMSLNKKVDIKTPWIDLLSIHPDWRLTRNELAAKVVAVCFETLQKLESQQLSGLASKWNPYDMLLNKNVKFLHDGEIKTGYVEGIDDLGQIILKMKDEIRHLHASYISEIKIIGKSE